MSRDQSDPSFILLAPLIFVETYLYKSNILSLQDYVYGLLVAEPEMNTRIETNEEFYSTLMSLIIVYNYIYSLKF